MEVYILNIILITFFSILFKKINIKKYNVKFSILISLLWILLSGLRHPTIGGQDVYISYLPHFEAIKSTNWNIIVNNFIQVILNGQEGKDPGYNIIVKLISYITTNQHFFLLIIASFFMIPFGFYVSTNSKDPFISYLIYSTLFFSFFSLTGFRQSIATGLIVLIGYRFIKQRKLIPFLILTLISIVIHKSAICFFPFYFIGNKKINLRNGIILVILLAIFIYYNRLIYTIIGYEDYSDNISMKFSTFAFMMLAITILMLWRRNKILKNSTNNIYLVNAFLIAMIFTLFSMENHAYMRIQQYYSLFLVILYPEIIDTFIGRNKQIFRLFSITILMLLFLLSKHEYIFFWQNQY